VASRAVVDSHPLERESVARASVEMYKIVGGDEMHRERQRKERAEGRESEMYIGFVGSGIDLQGVSFSPGNSQSAIHFLTLSSSPCPLCFCLAHAFPPFSFFVLSSFSSSSAALQGDWHPTLFRWAPIRRLRAHRPDHCRVSHVRVQTVTVTLVTLIDSFIHTLYEDNEWTEKCLAKNAD
jgi:hypothetical protein